ncbi:MAG TPA: HAD hydrolase family protein [Gemmatimonadaceae bacterium]|nr:HAD hydrolase family protein [Gemmatimonadaceae bacterium]
MIDPVLARRIRLVGLDVDGVLTDGGIYLGDVGGAPMEFKRYDIQDGLGIRLLRSAGVIVVIVTGRVSESVRMRAAEFQVDDLVQDARARKVPAFRRILDRHAVRARDAAFVGDDLPDLGILRLVGLPVAVQNAVPEIRDLCSVQLARSGGHGAVREFAEALLRARGEWDEMVARYVAEREAPAEEAIR